MKKIIFLFALVLALFATGRAENKIKGESMNEVPKISAFPTGSENTGFSKYFTGKSWLAPLTQNKDLNCPVFNVTFEPKCRNNWHEHTGGQMLIAIGGVGYYQEKGKPARRLLPGNIVEIAPNTIHWHGAAPDSWFSHLAVETNPQSNKNTWHEPVSDAEYAEATVSGNVNAPLSALQQTDPEFAKIFDSFAFGDVPKTGDLPVRSRYMAIVASLLGCQGVDMYRAMLPDILKNLSPVEVKEIIYQATAYLGIGRTMAFINATNEVFTVYGIALPLEPQGTTTPATRREAGTQAQVDIFGDRMKDFYKSGAENRRHINLWLAANCFGDYYTRKGLNLREREMITFCFLAAQGGCEAQLNSHIEGNIRVGNDSEFLIKVISQCMPYIGYPRTLNALKCLENK